MSLSVEQLFAAILRALLPDPADQLCAAFRGSLDGDALDDLLIGALCQAAADPDFMAPVRGWQSREQQQAELESQYWALRERMTAKYGDPFEVLGRTRARGPGLHGRVWC